MIIYLEVVSKCTRVFLLVENLRPVRVMNPWVRLRALPPSNIWGDERSISGRS
jgi:hypothetical protein